jgi:cell division septation protein DedD
VAAPVAPIDWPRDRSVTYMQKFLRMWAKRAAIVAGVFVAINMVFMGANFLWASQTPAEAAAPLEAPMSAAPEVAQPEPTAAVPVAEVPPAEAPATETPLTAPAASAAVAGEYFVAVGLFASAERADQLVEDLTQAGLPAMQRPFRLRRQDVQQIVLGPFFSRADAVSDLRRLQALGGYDDASVISN